MHMWWLITVSICTDIQYLSTRKSNHEPPTLTDDFHVFGTTEEGGGGGAEDVWHT